MNTSSTNNNNNNNNNSRINKYKNPGAKRLMLEAQELRDKTEDYCAQPIDDNLFEWHFTVRGPPETAFEGGYYHGRLSFPTEYPMKPPSIILLTPNGRFETNKKICLSISGYHPETWQPSWSVRTALLALIAFMPTKAHRAIGSLDFSDAERRKLAQRSRTWRCETCGLIKDLLAHPNATSNNCMLNSNKACSSRVASDGDNSTGSRSDSSSSSSSCSYNTENQDGKSQSSDSEGESSNNQSDSHKSTSNLSNNDEVELNIAENSCHRSTNIKASISDTPKGNRIGSDGELHESKNQASPTNLNVTPVLRRDNVVVEGRRSYPPLVFISISVLLFLLILRRVIMTIQSV